MRKHWRPGGLTVAILVITLAVTACASPLIGIPGGQSGGGSGPSGQPPSCALPGPGQDFDRADPSSVDIDPAAVAQAVTYASATNAQSVRVYRHDCLIATSGLDPQNESTPLPAWSMTKGVVSIVVGRAVQMGLVHVDDPIGRYLTGIDAAHGAITIRQFLNQTSGLRFAWINDLNLAATGDSAMLTLQRPFEANPGTQFRYAQTTVTVLVAVIEAATGEDFQAFARRTVFAPIGIPDQDWYWQRDAVGRSQGFAFLSMAPRSFARLGELLLHRGNWNGDQLLSTDYIDQGSHGTAANGCYGFLWWTNDGDTCDSAGPTPQTYDRPLLGSAPRDLFELSGLFDQNVFVIPSLDMVVVRMGLPHDLTDDPMGMVAAQHPDWAFRFFRYLLSGLRDRTYTDPGDWKPDPPQPALDPMYLLDPTFR